MFWAGRAKKEHITVMFVLTLVTWLSFAMLLTLYKIYIKLQTLVSLPRNCRVLHAWIFEKLVICFRKEKSSWRKKRGRKILSVKTLNQEKDYESNELLSPPQRLLLVNTNDRKIRERERWTEKMGARGTMGRGRKGEPPFSLFPSQRSPVL